MSYDANAIHFFLGANTSDGFVFRPDELGSADGGWHKFLIKGGPGTGKSTLCKQVAKAASEFTDNIEFLHCSSDPHSLDGVIISDYKISLFDATSPHVVEPKYPGAFESVINLCDCWDEDALQQNRDEVVALFAANQGCHARCSKFLAASGSLLNDTYHIALECTNIPKLSRYVTRLISRELKAKAAGTGQEKVRFLSAVTVGGLMMFTDTAKAYCDRVYVIDDRSAVCCCIASAPMRSRAAMTSSPATAHFPRMIRSSTCSFRSLVSAS